MATLPWIDFTAHNARTDESVRAFSVNHPQAGRLVVLKGVEPAYESALVAIGFTQTRDGSFVVPAAQLSIRQLQSQVYPGLQAREVELADIDLTEQFLNPRPAEPRPMENAGLQYLINSVSPTDTEGLSRYAGPLPTTAALSLWEYLEQNAEGTIQPNGQIHYRGSYQGQPFLIQRRQRLLSDTERVIFHWADTPEKLPDLQNSSQAPALFRLSDEVSELLARADGFYGTGLSGERPATFVPDRRLGQLRAQRALNESDLLEGQLFTAQLPVQQTLVLADGQYDTGLSVRHLNEIMGGDETNALLIDLPQSGWITEPEQPENPAGSPGARIDASVLAELPGLHISAENRGFQAIAYYREEALSQEITASPYIADSGVALRVQALPRTNVTIDRQTNLVNQNRLPDGYEVDYGTGQRDGHLRLLFTETTEPVTRDGNAWFTSLIDAVEALSLPENQPFEVPDERELDRALNEAFTEATPAEATTDETAAPEAELSASAETSTEHPGQAIAQQLIDSARQLLDQEALTLARATTTLSDARLASLRQYLHTQGAEPEAAADHDRLSLSVPGSQQTFELYESGRVRLIQTDDRTYDRERVQVRLQNVLQTVRLHAETAVSKPESERHAYLSEYRGTLIESLREIEQLAEYVRARGDDVSEAIAGQLPDLVALEDPVLTEVFERVTDETVSLEIDSIAVDQANRAAAEAGTTEAEPALENNYAMEELALYELSRSANYEEAGLDFEWNDDNKRFNVYFTKGSKHLVGQAERMHRGPVIAAILTHRGHATAPSPTLIQAYRENAAIDDGIAQLIDEAYGSRMEDVVTLLETEGYTNINDAPDGEGVAIALARETAGQQWTRSITWRVGDTTIHDDLSLSVEELRETIVEAAKAVEQAQADTALQSTGAQPETVFDSSWPKTAKTHSIEDFVSIEQAQQALAEGNTVDVYGESVYVRPSSVGWVVKTSRDGTITTRGGDPRGAGYSRGQAVERASNMWEFLPHFAQSQKTANQPSEAPAGAPAPTRTVTGAGADQARLAQANGQVPVFTLAQEAIDMARDALADLQPPADRSQASIDAHQARKAKWEAAIEVFEGTMTTGVDPFELIDRADLPGKLVQKFANRFAELAPEQLGEQALSARRAIIEQLSAQGEDVVVPDSVAEAKAQSVEQSQEQTEGLMSFGSLRSAQKHLDTNDLVTTHEAILTHEGAVVRPRVRPGFNTMTTTTLRTDEKVSTKAEALALLGENPDDYSHIVKQSPSAWLVRRHGAGQLSLSVDNEVYYYEVTPTDNGTFISSYKTSPFNRFATETVERDSVEELLDAMQNAPTWEKEANEQRQEQTEERQREAQAQQAREQSERDALGGVTLNEAFSQDFDQVQNRLARKRRSGDDISPEQRTLRQMRNVVFDAEEALTAAFESRDPSKFDEFASDFPLAAKRLAAMPEQAETVQAEEQADTAAEPAPEQSAEPVLVNNLTGEVSELTEAQQKVYTEMLALKRDRQEMAEKRLVPFRLSGDSLYVGVLNEKGKPISVTEVEAEGRIRRSDVGFLTFGFADQRTELCSPEEFERRRAEGLTVDPEPRTEGESEALAEAEAPAQATTEEPTASAADPEAAPVADLFGEPAPAPADSTSANTLVIEPGANDNQFVVSGPALLRPEVTQALEARGGQYVKKYAGYRFSSRNEKSVRQWIADQVSDGTLQLDERIRTPIELREGMTLPNGRIVKSIEYSTTFNAVRVEVETPASDDIMRMISHDDLPGMEATEKVTITNREAIEQQYTREQSRAEIGTDQGPSNDELTPEDSDALINDIEPDREHRLLRGRPALRIGQNAQGETLFADEDGLRFRVDQTGSLFEEVPQVGERGEYLPPVNRDDAFKLSQELSAEAVDLGENIVPLFQAAGDQPQEKKTPEQSEADRAEFKRVMDSIGYDAEFEKLYLQAYNKVRDYERNNENSVEDFSKDFTHRRLVRELNQVESTLAAQMRTAGFNPNPEIFNLLRSAMDTLREQKDTLVKTLVDVHRNFTITNEINRITPTVAKLMTRSTAQALPPQWLHEKLERISADEHAPTRALIIAKAYGTVVEIESMMEVIDSKDPEARAVLSEAIEQKYAKQRALVELPARIRDLEQFVSSYTGRSPIPKDNAERKLQSLCEELAEAQFDVNAIEVEEQDLEIYRLSPSAYDAMVALAERHGMSMDAARLFETRIAEEAGRRNLEAYMASEPVKVGLAIPEALHAQTELPDDLRIDTEINPHGSYHRIPWGAGEITIGFPDNTYYRSDITDDAPRPYRVDFRYSTGSSGQRGYNAFDTQEYATLPTAQTIARDAIGLFNRYRVESVDISKAPVFGAKFSLDNEDLYNDAAIAKKIRADIKEAIATGALPNGLKISVRKSNGLTAEIKAVPEGFSIINPDYVAFVEENPHEFFGRPERLTHEALALTEAVEGYVNAYNFDKSDPMTDYFNRNYSGGVQFDYDLIEQATAEVKAKQAVSEFNLHNTIFSLLSPSAAVDLNRLYEIGFVYIEGRETPLRFDPSINEKLTGFVDHNGLSVEGLEGIDPLFLGAARQIVEAYQLLDRPAYRAEEVQEQPSESNDQEGSPPNSEKPDNDRNDPSSGENPDPTTQTRGLQSANLHGRHDELFQSFIDAGIDPNAIPASASFGAHYVGARKNADGSWDAQLATSAVAGDQLGLVVESRRYPSYENALQALGERFEKYAKNAFRDQQAPGICDAISILTHLEKRIGDAGGDYRAQLLDEPLRTVAAKGGSALNDYYESLVRDQGATPSATDIVNARIINLVAFADDQDPARLELAQLASGHYVLGADIPMANGQRVSFTPSPENELYLSPEQAAGAFLRTVKDLAPQILSACSEAVFNQVPIQAKGDNVLPEVEADEASRLAAVLDVRIEALDQQIRDAGNARDPEVQELVGLRDGLADQRDGYNARVALNYLQTNPYATLDLSTASVAQIASQYQHLRESYNALRIEEVQNSTETSQTLRAHWLKATALDATHVPGESAVEIREDLGSLNQVGVLAVTERYRNSTSEPVYIIDTGDLSDNLASVLTNQARLSGAMAIDQKLIFSDLEQLERFTAEHTLAYRLRTQTLNDPQYDTRQVNSNLEPWQVKELHQFGFIQTETPHAWVVNAEGGTSVRLEFYRGVEGSTIDAQVIIGAGKTRREAFFNGLPSEIDAAGLIGKLNDELVDADLGEVLSPAPAPAIHSITDEKACAMVLAAGMNIEHRDDPAMWVVSGDTYAHRQSLYHLGGKFHEAKRGRAYWEFRENPVYRLGAALAGRITSQEVVQSVEDGYILRVGVGENDNSFIVRAHEEGADSSTALIVSQDDSLGRARTSTLTPMLEPGKLKATFEAARAQAKEKEFGNALKERLESDGLDTSNVIFAGATGSSSSDEPTETQEKTDAQSNQRPSRTAPGRAAAGNAAGTGQRQPRVDERPGADVSEPVVEQGRAADRERLGSSGRAVREQQPTAVEHGGTPGAAPVASADAGSDHGRVLRDAEPRQLFDFRSAQPGNQLTDSDRAHATREALDTLLQLREDKRSATPEEQATLSRFVGLGARQFNGKNDGVFQSYRGGSKNGENDRIADSIKRFSQEERSALQSTVLTAFFTPAEIRQFMWEGLEHMGVNDQLPSLDVVEPAAGTGHFVGDAPAFVRHGARIQAIEIDPITSEIARHLYPEAQVINRPFQDVQFPANSKDLVIGNPPYSDVRTYNPATGRREVIHDLFLRESIKATRPGGMVAFVTSSGTMDKSNDELRSYIATQADLVHAIRLPNSAFDESGTEVMTDILFFRKRLPNEPARDTNWVSSKPQSFEFLGYPVELNVNQYFIDNPGHVIGQLKATSGRFGPTLSCAFDGNLGQALRRQLPLLPERVFTPQQSARTNRLAAVSANTAEVVGEELMETHRVGSWYLADDDQIRLIQYDGAQAKYFSEVVPLKRGQEQLAREYIALRDMAKTLVEAESQPEGSVDEKEIDRLRSAVNARYDEFVAAHGPVNRKATMRTLQVDPDAYFVAALENYDKDLDQAEKADILKQRVIRPAPRTAILTANDAIYASMSNFGFIDTEFAEDALARPWSEIEKEVGDAIFLDPETGHYTTAAIYLSGDVIHKREVAERALVDNPALERNVAALKAIAPKPIPVTDIHVKLGATWMPDDLVQDFARTLMNAKQYPHADRMTVRYNDILNAWQVKATDALRRDRDSQFTIEYGTRDVPFHKILEHSLAQTRPRVYTDAPGGKRVLHAEKTQAACDKQAQIEEQFRSWILEDGERARRVQGAYNYRLNRFVRPEPDGKYLSFPGVTDELKGRPFNFGDHQLGVIERALTSPYGTLLAHEAGGGKTISTTAIAIKHKQLGLAKKPMIAVPNHMLVQFTKEALELYPNARILTVTPEDMSKEGRALFAQKCRLNDWDLVICTHSQYQRMSMPQEYVERDIENQIADLEIMLLEADDKITIKELERSKRKLEEKLKEANDRLSANSDDIDFTTLGVDWIGYDEGHYLKNMDLPTKNRGLAGVGSRDALRSRDSLMKFDWIREQRGDEKGVLLATGTPISNTVGEIMVMMRYLAPSLLKRAGIHNFDQFIANFGAIKQHLEITADGSSYQTKERLSGFRNIPELMRLFTQVADIKMGDDLNLERPEENRITHVTEMTPEQKLFMDWLGHRATLIKNKLVKPHEDIMLNIYTDLRKSSVDMRLIHPKLTDDPNSKLNTQVREIFERWKDGQDNKDTQLIFCDFIRQADKEMRISKKTGKLTVKTVENLNLYKDIKKKLIDLGIPRDEIAFIHDAKTNEEKEQLFERMRSGKVRICLASTEKMGVGTNVQTRLKDLHHLSLPMRSIDMEQRNKRAVRQGNMHKSVNLHYPITRGSGDLASLQMLDRKEKMVRQIMYCDFENMLRSFDDDHDPTYEELMALTTDNPVIKEKIETDTRVHELQRMRRSHDEMAYRARSSLVQVRQRDLPWLEDELKHVESLRQTIDEKPESFEMKVQGKVMDKYAHVGGAAHELWRTMSAYEEEKDFGKYRGLPVKLKQDSDGALLEVVTPGDGRNISIRVSKSLSSFPSRLVEKVDERLAQAERLQERIEAENAQIDRLETLANTPFEHEQELADLTDRQKDLNQKFAKWEEENKAEVKAKGWEHPFEVLLKKLNGEAVDQDSARGALSDEEIQAALAADENQEEHQHKVISGPNLTLV